MADEVQPGSAPGAVAIAEPPTEETKQPIEQTTAAEQPTGDTPAGEPAQEAQETEVNLEEQPESSGDFAKYKSLFKDNPELRSILGREKAFSELAPSFSELKGIVERVPTLDDAETLATQAENHRVLGETFRTDPAGFVESLKENDPNAFQTLARQLPQILAETDSQVYAEQARYYTNSVLDNLWAMAQQSGNQELLAAVQKVAAEGLGYQLGSNIQRASGQPNSELEKLRRQLKERDQAEASGAVESFWGELDSTFAGTLYADIEAAVKKAVPSATEAQITRMVGEAVTKANHTLESQPQTMSQVKQYRALAEKGKTSVSDFRAALDYLTRRGKLVVPSTVKGVVEEWSKSVLQINKQQIEKKQAIAATTKDVGGAVQATSAAGTQSNGNKKSGTRESIFKQIEAGTYQPRA